MPKYLSPFVTNEQSESARCFQPGEMDESEVIEFPEFAKLPTVYLAIRNVCVTLWNLNPDGHFGMIVTLTAEKLGLR
jgi:hypothetical protein